MREFNHLTRFEKLARQLVEGTLDRLLGGESATTQIAAQLAQAMEASQRGGVVADLYRVKVHPGHKQRLLQEQPGLTSFLANYLERLAGEAGYVYRRAISVELIDDLELGQTDTDAEADYRRLSLNATQPKLAISEPSILETIRSIDAFLIVGGNRHIPLHQPVITVGRLLDNDVVLEDASVSRKHAQIRWRHGRFVIYDLGSRCGTVVNGERSVERVLQEGDVIEIGAISIIYGEERGESQVLWHGSSSKSATTLALHSEEE